MGWHCVLLREGRHSDAKTASFPKHPEFEDLLSTASNKLRMRARSLYLPGDKSGTELLLTPELLARLKLGARVVCSPNSCPNVAFSAGDRPSQSEEAAGMPLPEVQEPRGGLAAAESEFPVAQPAAIDKSAAAVKAVADEAQPGAMPAGTNRRGKMAFFSEAEAAAEAATSPVAASACSSVGPQGAGHRFLSHQPACNVRVLCSKSFVEAAAVRQLEQVGDDFLSVRHAVGMPDLHPGPRFPIGAAIAVEGQVLPFLVGSDVGCGMTLFSTDLKGVSAKKAQRWATGFGALDGPWAGGNPSEWLQRQGVEPTLFDTQLGTVGGGNHFAELQAVHEVLDAAALQRLGMDSDRLYLLVHSGSRSLGQNILRQHLEEHQTAPLDDGTPHCQAYMERHDHACEWARANRRLIARRFFDAIGLQESAQALAERRGPVLDVCHNSVVAKQGWGEGGLASHRLWLHRKGAAPIDSGPVVIPGSRGSYSYLVAPACPSDSPAAAHAAYSVAHGAGRKWSRSHALGVGRARFPNPAALRTTALGSAVICGDASLLYEEAPDAYKEVSDIVADLGPNGAGVINVVAVLRPVLTYKSASATTSLGGPP